MHLNRFTSQDMNNFESTKIRLLSTDLPRWIIVKSKNNALDDQISNGVNTDIHRYNYINISYFENIELTQITENLFSEWTKF